MYWQKVEQGKKINKCFVKFGKASIHSPLLLLYMFPLETEKWVVMITSKNTLLADFHVLVVNWKCENRKKSTENN